MASIVKLNEKDRQLIIDTLQKIVDYKYRTLSVKAWMEFEDKWLPSFINQLDSNEFKINSIEKNSFNWFIDQMRHSRTLDNYGKPKSNPLIIETEIGIAACEICRCAAKGQLYYDGFCRQLHRNKILIEEE